MLESHQLVAEHWRSLSEALQPRFWSFSMTVGARFRAVFNVYIKNKFLELWKNDQNHEMDNSIC
jgi:hypothetical protein